MGDTGISPKTLSLIKHFEGYTAKPKWDEKQYSVGYSTRWEPGTPVGTRADHEAALAREVGNVDQWLNQNVSVPMTDDQRAALNSFGYNTGTGSLDRLKDDINRGDWDRVGQRMLSFSRAGDDPEALLPRRKDEVALMLQGRDPSNGRDPADDSQALTPVQTASANMGEKGKTMGLFDLLSGGGAFGAGNAGLPSLPSGTDPNAMQNLFGTLGAFSGGGQSGGSDQDNMKLATVAATAAGKDEDAMTKMAPRPFDMQKLAAMLSKSGYLGTGAPRRTA